MQWYASYSWRSSQESRNHANRIEGVNLTWVAIYALAFFVLWGVTAGVGPARAVTETVEVTTPAEHDSYVDSGDIPNYGRCIIIIWCSTLEYSQVDLL